MGHSGEQAGLTPVTRQQVGISKPRGKEAQDGPSHRLPVLKRLKVPSPQGYTLTIYILTMIKCLNRLPRLLLEYPPCEMPKTWIDGTLNNLVPSCNRRLHHAASRISFQSRIFFIIIIFSSSLYSGKEDHSKDKRGC